MAESVRKGKFRERSPLTPAAGSAIAIGWKLAITKNEVNVVEKKNTSVGLVTIQQI